jgi:integrase/recombinase XerC
MEGDDVSHELARREDAPRLPAVAEIDLMAAIVAGLKPSTRKAYQAGLRDFAVFVGMATPDGAANLLIAGTHGQANGAALAYKASMIDRGLAPATINQRLASIRKTCDVAETLGRIAWRLKVRGLPREAREDRRGPDHRSWSAMLAAAETEAATGGPIGLRNLAIVRTLHDMALRRGELASLDVAHLDVADSCLWVVGKGKRERQRLTIPAPTLAAILGWLDARGDQPGALFIRLDPGANNMGPTRLDSETLNRIVKALGLKAGAPRRTRAHGLRHASITRALDVGRDIRSVQKFSRHASLDMVLRYDDARGDTFGDVASEIAGG